MGNGEEAGPVLSVVMPIFNEEAGLKDMLERLYGVLGKAGVSFEVVAVDDGSRDRSWEMLVEARSSRPGLNLVRLSRNFGHTAAVTAGLDHAAGQAVVLMDADLQDPPELLPGFLGLWREGNHVVYAVRRNRKEGLFRRMSTGLFYWISAKLASISIVPDAGHFCLMDRRVVDLLRGMPERNRFLPGLRTWVGFRQVGYPYDRPGRAHGEAVQTLPKLFKLAFDGIASFSYVPLRISSIAGAVVGLAGFLFAIVAAVVKVTNLREVPLGATSMIVLLCLIGGTQLLALGILGEYLARIYDEVKQRPTYVVGETAGTERRP
jgi:dolichol-phosphate mannosyltransferase